MLKPLTPAILVLLTQSVAAEQNCDLARILFQQATQATELANQQTLLQQSLAACPSFAAYYDYGRLLLKQKQYDAALIHFKQAWHQSRAQSPEETKALAQLARVHFEQKNPAQAAVYIEKAYANQQNASPNWILQLRQDIDLANANRVTPAEEIQLTMLAGKDFGVTPKMQFNSITFHFDSTELTKQGQQQVLELGKVLKQLSAGKTVRLIGHTDQIGDSGYNQALSERRAQAVRTLLVQKYPQLQGLLTTQGKGESELKYTGNEEKDHQLNRRVEVEWL